MSHTVEPRTSLPGGEQVFDNMHSRSGNATYFFLGGFGLIGLAIAGFIAMIGIRHGQLPLHMTTTLPILIAVGLLARGMSLRNIPRRIVVGPQAIEVTTRQSTRRFPWSEIGSASTANVLNSQKTCLRITDTRGKAIVRVDESLCGRTEYQPPRLGRGQG